MAGNAGNTDEHRALNYLAMRYQGIYAKTAEQFVRIFHWPGGSTLFAIKQYWEDCR